MKKKRGKKREGWRKYIKRKTERRKEGKNRA
jgi:hypothetical protein